MKALQGESRMADAAVGRWSYQVKLAAIEREIEVRRRQAGARGQFAPQKLLSEIDVLEAIAADYRAAIAAENQVGEKAP
jgi:hypothetical protein